jgi:DNA topoisomerase-1
MRKARRVLDRLVGYELSPYCGKIKEDFQQVVQVVSVRLIVMKEIFSFNAVATYSVVAEFTNEVGKAFKLNYPKISILKKEAEDF